MARPKSDDRRNAILETAAKVIAVQGLSAPTALIAKEAGVATGSLFTYFPTKRDLLNQLYVYLKTEMAAAALDGLPEEADARSQFAHMWAGWLGWAVSNTSKRRALAQLSVSDEISKESREVGHHLMAGVGHLLERSRENGPMRSAPLGLVSSLLNAMAEATIDFIASDPDNARTYQDATFDAAWRMIA